MVSTEGQTLLEEGKANWPRRCIQRSALYKQLLKNLWADRYSELSCDISEHLMYDELMKAKKGKNQSFATSN